ncbi:MAG: hypothetical protein EAZ36_06650, partial [Verrucomicrobia bacterium]
MLGSIGLVGVLSAAGAPLGAEPTLSTRQAQAASTPPAIVVAPESKSGRAVRSTPASPLYSIGTPTDAEQAYLELINRARANPKAEGIRLATTTDANVLSAYSFFVVDLVLMKAEFEALPVRPPLAMNARLTNAARGHSNDMFTQAFQGHTGSGGSTLGTRATAAGYNFASLGENVFSYSDSTWHGHAGFQVDWGNDGGAGGMQLGRGHRANIHGDFREIGVGVVSGTNTVGGSTVGPQLVTQNLGTAQGTTAFVTGVAYYDVNTNGAYDEGEGLGGVTVEVSGANHSAITTPSGGYAIPVPTTNAIRSVAFAGSGLAFATSATITGGANVKVDFTPTYLAPVVSAPAATYIGSANAFGVSSVGGATGYEWQVATKTPAPADSADSLAAVTAVTGAYTPLSTTVKHSGTAAYRLAHPSPGHQTLTYPGEFFVGPAASLQFQSRLGFASSDQVAQVEVSSDGGGSWSAVFTQPGTGGSGESNFTARVVSLAAYAGKVVRLRFRYAFTSGSWFDQTSDGVGWYVDAVNFTQVFALTDRAVAAVTSGRTFLFSPLQAGTYQLSARALLPGRTLPFGPVTELTPVVAPPYLAWSLQQEASGSLPSGSLQNNPTADYNGDGVP